MHSQSQVENILFEIFGDRCPSVSLSPKIHFLQSSLKCERGQSFTTVYCQIYNSGDKVILEKTGTDFSQEFISGWVDELYGPDCDCDQPLHSNAAANACEILPCRKRLLGAQHPYPLSGLSNGARIRQGHAYASTFI